MMFAMLMIGTMFSNYVQGYVQGAIPDADLIKKAVNELNGLKVPKGPIKARRLATRDAYMKAANELKLATGPYKAARDAYVAATATYTKSKYE